MRPSTAPLRPFGRYLLLSEVGLGGMAEVFLARALNGAPAHLLALKRLRPELAADSVFTGMFLDEGRIAGRLDHPHIATVRELGSVGDTHYLTMDYVWGKDVLHIVQRCRELGAMPPAAFVAYVGVQLAAALGHAHEMRDGAGRPLGVVHRDVSPQNVLVGFDGAVRVIDFGIAKAAARVTRTQEGMLKGKLGYMSPEQASGGDLDGRSDLFAAATCLYELLTLRSLFTRVAPIETMSNVREMPVPPVRTLRQDVPVALDTALSRALEKQRDDRFATADALREALQDALDEAEPGYGPSEAKAFLEELFLKERREEARRLDAMARVGGPQLWPLGQPDPVSTPVGRRVGAGAPTSAPPVANSRVPLDPTSMRVLWARDREIETAQLEAPSGPDEAPTSVFEAPVTSSPSLVSSSLPVSDPPIALDAAMVIPRAAPLPRIAGLPPVTAGPSDPSQRAAEGGASASDAASDLPGPEIGARGDRAPEDLADSEGPSVNAAGAHGAPSTNGLNARSTATSAGDSVASAPARLGPPGSPSANAGPSEAALPSLTDGSSATASQATWGPDGSVPGARSFTSLPPRTTAPTAPPPAKTRLGLVLLALALLVLGALGVFGWWWSRHRVAATSAAEMSRLERTTAPQLPTVLDGAPPPTLGAAGRYI